MSDAYLVGVLVLVTYMGAGVVLGAAARHLKPVTTGGIFVFLTCSAVIAYSWQALHGFHGFSGVMNWLFQSFAWYGTLAIGLLALPGGLTFLAVHWATNRARSRQVEPPTRRAHS